jgi:hypothetical protein
MQAGRLRIRWAGIVMAALLIMLTVTGCGNSSGLVGKWKGDFTLGNSPVVAIWEFKSDGTMTQKLDGSNVLKSCTYKVKEGKVTIIPVKQTTFGRTDEQFLNTEAPQVYMFDIYGDTLTLTWGQTKFQMTKTYI